MSITSKYYCKVLILKDFRKQIFERFLAEGNTKNKEQ